MKCNNPSKCTGEMKAYKGLSRDLVECEQCGFRTEASKAEAKPKQVLSTENKEKK